jgi:hypothetical protein
VGEDGFLVGRAFALLNQRLVSVGGFSSLSDIST